MMGLLVQFTCTGNVRNLIFYRVRFLTLLLSRLSMRVGSLDLNGRTVLNAANGISRLNGLLRQVVLSVR